MLLFAEEKKLVNRNRKSAVRIVHCALLYCLFGQFFSGVF